MNYYCLIAGLPDLVEDTKSTIRISELKSELFEQLSMADWQLLSLIFASYDNENLIAYLANKEAELNPLGNLNATDWNELLTLISETESPRDPRLNPYIINFVQTIGVENGLPEGVSKTDFLTSLYYAEAIGHSNDFVSKWYAYNLNLNNVLTAIISRKHGYNLQNAVIGDNEIANNLRQSQAKDFGLTNLFADFELIHKISDEPDLMEREKKIDALKWNWLDDATFFHYFSIEKVIAYVLKLQLMERWQMLTIEKGREVFRHMLNQLKKEVDTETTNS